MDDLISRQTAIDAADRADYTELAVEDVKKVTDEVIKELKQLPSAQTERKKGKWIRITDEVFADRFECSECGKLPPIENFEWWLSDYCPNCGADMRGEPNEYI